MPSQYSSDTKAEALALLRRGETALATANILDLPERTVSRWAVRWREATDGDDEILADEDTRIALRAAELIHDWFDAAEQLPPEQLLKHGLALNVLRGTAVDKRLKRQQLSAPAHAGGPVVIAIFPDKETRTIEGKVETIG